MMVTDSYEDAARAHALLSVEEMGRADALTIESGVDGLALMESAGGAVAEEILRRYAARPAIVLCGPGNNGGDGFVIARILAERGWPVRVALLGDTAKLKGDAAQNAKRWTGEIESLDPSVLDGASLVVDALFGAGLDRPLEGAVLETVERVGVLGQICVAVDMPSGVRGDTGEVLGGAPNAELTVTFFRKKPGHLLLPGRLRCGETVVRHIGIQDAVLEEISPRLAQNHPDLWRDVLRLPTLLDHKYSRGHLLVAGGQTMTGAARLAARAGLRVGAGMVSLAVPSDALPVYAADTAALVTRPTDTPGEFAALVQSPKVAAAVLGPGLGVGDDTRARAQAALASGKPCVLDADALTVFEGVTDGLAGGGPKILTPHEGEFRRLFDVEGSKLDRALAAAKQIDGILLLKGGDTVIASPDGRAAITANAPAWLATAGAGDVLAGLIGGLLAQGLPAFEAALAGSWIHAEAAAEFGAGLIADDLPEMVPGILDILFAGRHEATGL